MPNGTPASAAMRLEQNTMENGSPDASPCDKSASFDTSRYLTKPKGNDSIGTKRRLLWLRTALPEAVITTELMAHDGQHAIVCARVAIPGGGTASGWGSEAYNAFRDDIEKAETKALGRALIVPGFGTQFTDDLGVGEEEEQSAPSRQSAQP